MSEYLAGVKERYKENELLVGRRKTERNVLGCVARDLTLLDDCDIKSMDFLDEKYHYYISLFLLLRKSGLTVVDEASVDSVITDSMRDNYKEKGGWDAICELQKNIRKENFSSYYDTLCRENLILSLYDSGFNLFGEVTDNGKKIIPLTLFRKMKCEDVLDWYEARLNAFNRGTTDAGIIEEEIIDFDDEYIESVINGESAGVPFDLIGADINGDEIRAFPFISSQINGYMDGTFNILAGHSSVGKTSLYLQIIMSLIFRGRKVLIISNEQAVKYFKMLLMIYIISEVFHYRKITRSKATAGQLSPEDIEMMQKAKEWWEKNLFGSLKIIRLTDANMGVVKRKIRENVLRHGYDVFLYDTFKLDMSDNGNTDEKAYLSMIRDSRVLAQIAAKYNIVGLASVQLALASLGRLWLDSSCLSTAKAIKEIAETLFLVRNAYPEEFDPNDKKHYMPLIADSDSYDRVTHFKYQNDRSYKVLFIDKNRNGQDVSNGTAHLLEFDGDHGVFREVCRCKPKHGKID